MEYDEAHKHKGKHNPLSAGKPPENWFISQEEEAAERDAIRKRAEELEAEGSTSPSSSGSITPGRKLRMSRSEKRRSMGIVSPDSKPEDH